MKNTLYAHVHLTMIYYTQPEFQSMSVNDKFVKYLLQNNQYRVAKCCYQAFSKRRQKLYD